MSNSMFSMGNSVNPDFYDPSMFDDGMPEGDLPPVETPDVVDNDVEPIFYVTPEVEDTRPAEERIESLIEGLPGRRDILLAIMAGCEEPKSDEEVTDIVNEAQRDNHSVFSALTLCGLLEKAGGLCHVLENGEPFVEEELEPETLVDEDGYTYIQAAEVPASYWQTTEEGKAYVEADDPVGRSLAVFAENEKYLPVYKYLLEVCSGNGAPTKLLQEHVDSHELVQDPRYYVQHFLKQLEDSGALVWKGAWVTTDSGAAALENLDAVEAI